MSDPIVFKGVFPIGDTDVTALPIQELESAIDYYDRVLGFALVSKDQGSALLQRDSVQIGIARNGNDPEQASCYFSVSDVEALRQELEAHGLHVSEIKQEEHNGKLFRVFFGKEPFGVCFCFGQPA